MQTNRQMDRNRQIHRWTQADKQTDGLEQTNRQVVRNNQIDRWKDADKQTDG